MRRSATTSPRRRSRATAGTAPAPRPAPGRSRSTRPSGWTRSRSGRGAELEARLAVLRDHPLVADIRRVGLWLALELRDPATGESLARGLRGRWAVAPLLSRLLLAHGCAAARMSEGLLHVAPPFVATDSDFDFIVERVTAVLDAAAPEIARL